MFKKAFKISAYNSIAGKDKKKLKKDVSKIFNSEVIEQIFNSELNDKIYQNKLQGSKIVIYSNEKFPLFIDATSKGDYFPSLYLVFAYPDLIEGIEINPGVENFLAKGANLMWPGVKSPHELGEFKKDDVRYIVDSNENIIGLGALGSSSNEIKEGMQGIALYILHTLGDKLWEFGPKSIPEVILKPKEEKLGFKKAQEVVSLLKGEDEGEEQKLEVKGQDEKGGIKIEDEKKISGKKIEIGGKKKGTGKKKKVKQQEEEEEEDEDDNFEGLMQFASKSKQLQSTEPKGDNALDQLLKQKKEMKELKEEINVKKTKGKKEKQQQEEKFSDDDKKKGKGKKKGKKEEEVGKGEIPTKIVDEYVYEAFMNALKVSISDKDLPIDSSVFYSSHMLQCKREGIMLELKFSSYKKIGKFFQVMGKQGLIDYKEAKKGTSPMIMKINRGNLKLEQWEPTISKAGKKNDEGEEKKSSGDNNEAFKLQISELFKPKKDSFAKLFESEKEHYTREEVRNAVLMYIKNNSELCKIEKQYIVLDPYLISQMQIIMDNEEVEEEEEKKVDVENNDQENQEEEEGEQQQQQKNQPKKRKHKNQVAKVTREEIFEKVEKSMLVYHKITNLTTKKEDIKAGAFKGIQLTTEKAHNKNITRVVGLETYGFNTQNLANKFQLKFATAVSLHDLPGKVSPGKEMIVQGNVLQDLIDFFTQECSIERKYINLNDKLGKKQKKN